MNYFICGFSGAGKSTVLYDLSQISELKSYEFLDLDDYIFSLQKGFQDLGAYIRSVGFEQFRNDELKALKILEQKKHLILSLGGGTLTSETIEFFSKTNQFQGVWLNTSFETCYARIEGDDNRPLSSKPKTELKNLYEARELNYSKFLPIKNATQVFNFIKNQEL